MNYWELPIKDFLLRTFCWELELSKKFSLGRRKSRGPLISEFASIRIERLTMSFSASNERTIEKMPFSSVRSRYEHCEETRRLSILFELKFSNWISSTDRFSRMNSWEIFIWNAWTGVWSLLYPNIFLNCFRRISSSFLGQSGDFHRLVTMSL